MTPAWQKVADFLVERPPELVRQALCTPATWNAVAKREGLPGAAEWLRVMYNDEVPEEVHWSAAVCWLTGHLPEPAVA